MKIISLAFRIDENRPIKRIKLFKPSLIKKLKKSKIIYYNKIIDIRAFIIIPNNKKILKIKLLILNKIPSLLKIKKGCTIPIEYIKNNDYIFSKLAIYKFPKISYKKDENNSENKIKIFGTNFVKNNENKFAIFYEGKIFIPHNEFFSYMDINKAKKLEIYLIIIEEISNVSYMFEQCPSLEEISINENGNIFIEYKELKNNHKIIFKDKNKENINTIINKEIKNLNIVEDKDFPLLIASSISEKNKIDINEIFIHIYFMFFFFF